MDTMQLYRTIRSAARELRDCVSLAHLDGDEQLAILLAGILDDLNAELLESDQQIVPAPTPAANQEGSEDEDSIGDCPVCDKPMYEGVSVDSNTVVHRDCVDGYREAVKP